MTALFALRGNKEVAEALLKSVKIKTEALGKVASASVSRAGPVCVCALRVWILAASCSCRCHTIMRTTVPGCCCCNYVAGCKTNCQQGRETRASKKQPEEQELQELQEVWQTWRRQQRCQATYTERKSLNIIRKISEKVNS